MLRIKEDISCYHHSLCKEFNCLCNPYLQALVTMSVTPRWLLVNSKIKLPKFKIYGFCQHPQNNSRGLLISRHGHRTTYHDPGVTAPNPTPQEPLHTVHPLLQAGARSTRSGLKVGVVDSLGWSFVWLTQAMSLSFPWKGQLAWISVCC